MFVCTRLAVAARARASLARDTRRVCLMRCIRRRQIMHTNTHTLAGCLHSSRWSYGHESPACARAYSTGYNIIILINSASVLRRRRRARTLPRRFTVHMCALVCVLCARINTSRVVRRVCSVCLERACLPHFAPSLRAHSRMCNMRHCSGGGQTDGLATCNWRLRRAPGAVATWPRGAWACVCDCITANNTHNRTRRAIKSVNYCVCVAVRSLFVCRSMEHVYML